MHSRSLLRADLLAAALMLLLTLVVVEIQCKEDPYEMAGQARANLPKNSEEITTRPILVKPLYKFTGNLIRAMKNSTQQNMIFSPVSMQMALNMLALGVTKDSQTEKDMLRALGHYSNTNSTNTTTTTEIHEANAQLRSVFDEIKRTSRESRRNPKLDMINFAIVKSPVNPEYLNQTNKYYGAAVRSVEKEPEQRKTLDEVNKWGKEAGFSGDILKSDDIAKAALILLNGVRVEAFWFDSFHKMNVSTNSSLYKAVDGGSQTNSSNKVALYSYETRIGYVEFTKNKQSKLNDLNQFARGSEPNHYDDLAGLEFRAIHIRLIGEISYTIIEPLAPNSCSRKLAQLEEALFESSNSSDTRMSRLMAIVDRSYKVAANVQMPGYKYERDIDLVPALKSIGMERLFDPSTADLGKMTPKRNLFVDQVKHQAMVEVNEKGLKAAAVTKIAVALSAIQHNRVIDVAVENPFLYVIRLNEVPLFVGHLVKV